MVHGLPPPQAVVQGGGDVSLLRRGQREAFTGLLQRLLVFGLRDGRDVEALPKHAAPLARAAVAHVRRTPKPLAALFLELRADRVAFRLRGAVPPRKSGV